MNDPNNLRSFLDHGYFSEYADKWSSWYIENNKQLFNDAININNIAHELMLKKVGVDQNTTKLEFYVFTILFVRSVSTYQAALVLLQRGLAMEAKIMTRACLECAFMLGAATNMGAGFIDRLIKAHNQARKKFGENIERINSSGVSLTEEESAQLRESIERHEADGVQSFDFAEIAKKGGLEHWYVFYRSLSNSAAHPSMDSLEYFFDEKTDEIVYEPNCDKEYLGDVVGLLSTFMIVCCNFFNDRLMDDYSIRERLELAFKKVERWKQSDAST